MPSEWVALLSYNLGTPKSTTTVDEHPKASIGTRIQECRDCRYFSPETFPWHHYPPNYVQWFHTFQNGMSLNVPGLGRPIPFHSDYIPCERHIRELNELDHKDGIIHLIIPEFAIKLGYRT